VTNGFPVGVLEGVELVEEIADGEGEIDELAPELTVGAIEVETEGSIEVLTDIEGELDALTLGLSAGVTEVETFGVTEGELDELAPGLIVGVTEVETLDVTEGELDEEGEIEGLLVGISEGTTEVETLAVTDGVPDTEGEIERLEEGDVEAEGLEEGDTEGEAHCSLLQTELIKLSTSKSAFRFDPLRRQVYIMYGLASTDSAIQSSPLPLKAPIFLWHSFNAS